MYLINRVIHNICLFYSIPKQNNSFIFIGGWWQYDSRTSTEIEEAYQRNPIVLLEILICGSLYCIDMIMFIQYNKDTPTNKRNIKRDIYRRFHSKGIAGISNF